MASKVAGRVQLKKKTKQNKTKPTQQSLPKLCFLNMLGLCQPSSENRRVYGLSWRETFIHMEVIFNQCNHY